jgi:hypothetical protein
MVNYTDYHYRPTRPDEKYTVFMMYDQHGHKTEYYAVKECTSPPLKPLLLAHLCVMVTYDHEKETHILIKNRMSVRVPNIVYHRKPEQHNLPEELFII